MTGYSTAGAESTKAYEQDDGVAKDIAALLDVPSFVHPVVLEGGSIEVNGAGTCLTTAQCLLNKNRNPQMSRGEIEQFLKDALGVSQVIWLGDGIAGDDTDGHIDDIARFVNPTTVVCVLEGKFKRRELRSLARKLRAASRGAGSRRQSPVHRDSPLPRSC